MKEKIIRLDFNGVDKDGIRWYSQGELNAKIIIAKHEERQKTAEEIFDEIEAEEGMAIGGCGFVATKDILELKKKWLAKK